MREGLQDRPDLGGAWRGWTALAAVLMLAVTACSGGGQPKGPDVAAQAVFDFEPDDGLQRVRPDRPITVTTPNALLTSVTLVRDGGGAQALSGSLSPDGRSWHYGGGLLPDSSYALTVNATGPDGKVTTEQSRFKTVPARQPLEITVTPGQGETVGVGQPIAVKFNAPVANKASVERRLVVTASKPVLGSWYWVSDTEVRYRPQKYWPAHSKVSLTSSLTGVDAGGGTWGGSNHVTGFNIGRSMVSVVDVNDYNMKVYRDGKLIRTIPVTSGKPGWRTRGGTKVVLAKDYVRVMDGSTVGAFGSEGYRLTVYYAVRVTWSGEFVHAAPWSVGSQGYSNVSHGCVGMSTGNGRWFYNESLIGDVIRVDGNESKPMELDNGFGDWNLSWTQWAKGSALA